MNNATKKIINKKLYAISVYMAFAYAIFLISFWIYNEFFFNDRTWLNDLMYKILIVISSLIWMGILFIFKQVLNDQFNKESSR